MKRISKAFLSVAAIACMLPALAPPAQAAKGDYIAYVGTYTRPNKSKGIYAWKFTAAKRES